VLAAVPKEEISCIYRAVLTWQQLLSNSLTTPEAGWKEALLEHPLSSGVNSCMPSQSRQFKTWSLPESPSRCFPTYRPFHFISNLATSAPLGLMPFSDGCAGAAPGTEVQSWAGGHPAPSKPETGNTLLFFSFCSC